MRIPQYSADEILQYQPASPLRSDPVALNLAPRPEFCSEYCRRKGLYPEQIQAWRKACQQANASAGVGVDREKRRQQAKEIKPLQDELRRKDKALAETAALLVLQKKVRIFLAEPADGK